MHRAAYAQLEDLASVLQGLRGARTQLEVARIIQEDAKHGTRVSAWERGERLPELGALARLLQHLGYSWQEFGALLDIAAEERTKRSAVEEAVRERSVEEARAYLDRERKAASKGGRREGSSENGR